MARPDEQPKDSAIKDRVPEYEIIIVDDDPMFSFMLQDYLLANADLNAELFANGAVFLEKYKINDPRYIILDYEFDAGPDGLSVLRKIKQLNPLAIVIVVSGLDNLEKALETIRNGAVDYFLKTNTTIFNNIVCSLRKIREIESYKMN